MKTSTFFPIPNQFPNPKSKIPSTLSASRSANGAEPLTSGGNLPGASYVLGKPQNYAPARHCQHLKSHAPCPMPHAQFPIPQTIATPPPTDAAATARGKVPDVLKVRRGFLSERFDPLPSQKSDQPLLPQRVGGR